MGLPSHHDPYVSTRLVNDVYLRMGVVILHALVLLGTDKASCFLARTRPRASWHGQGLVLLGTDKAAIVAQVSTEIMIIMIQVTARTTSTSITPMPLRVLRFASRPYAYDHHLIIQRCGGHVLDQSYRGL